MRLVRGSFFADYVRTFRRYREADWGRFLDAKDFAIVTTRIDPMEWYPMELFEKLGVGILALVADWSFTVPYAWGRISAGQLTAAYEGLLVPTAPEGTIERLHGLREMFFNFDPVMLASSSSNDAEIHINYQMRDISEAAASYQALGFYEEIIRLSGGVVTSAGYIARRWEGAEKSRLKLSWSLAESAPAVLEDLDE